MSLFDRALQLPDPEKDPLPEEQLAVLDKLSRQVVKRGMTVPAILFLESVKPLNYIGSQTMVFFEPIIQTVFNFKDYDTLRLALERRETIELLIQKIEADDAVERKHEKALKKFLKQERKKWKWYQRWLGIATPRVELPEELRPKPPEAADSKPTDEAPSG